MCDRPVINSFGAVFDGHYNAAIAIHMANQTHLRRLKTPAGWNQWRSREPRISPDLKRAHLPAGQLAGLQLTKADFTEATLYSANFCGSVIADAIFYNADLSAATLSRVEANFVSFRSAALTRADMSGSKWYGCDFGDTDFSGCELTGAVIDTCTITDATFHNASLRGATIIETDASGTDFRNAFLSRTIFIDVDLTGAINLDACRHYGPSVLDYGTLVKSRNLPLNFLRGCGFPDTFIEYLSSITGAPIQFNSCFISYSTHDQSFVECLHSDLQSKGVRCWYAPHDIKGGKKLHEQIDAAIGLYDRLLLVLSTNSINSEWVKTEIADARKREAREKRQMLFPIRLVDFETLRNWECFDADTGTDSAREIREYFIPDFSNWRDRDCYQRAFLALLRDLKAPIEKQHAVISGE